MIDIKLIEAFAFTAPIVCALTCMAMMLLDAYARRKHAQEKQLRLFLALTYLVTSFGWLGMVLYVLSPYAFASYYTIFLLALMLDQVMIYRFVTLITNTGKPYKFHSLHFIIPFFFTFASLINDFLVPVDQQVAVIFGSSEGEPNSWFRIMYAVTTLIFVVYNTLYPILNLRRIHQYKQFIVNYSAETYRTSLYWLRIIQILILISVPVPLAGLLFGIPVIASSFFVWFGALPYFINYALLCYNLLDNNYLIIVPETEETVDTNKNLMNIDRKYFEEYILKHKPYLNPQLRIVDIAADLQTNRTYLSGFINKEYGMNFSRYINRYRLQEIEILRVSPENATKTGIQLVLMAGFSSHRCYLRAKREEDKTTLLKI